MSEELALGETKILAELESRIQKTKDGLRKLEKEASERKRKAATRRKIELGGLFTTVGFTTFDVEVLTGALSEMLKIIETDTGAEERFKERGRKILLDRKKQRQKAAVNNDRQ